jgi:hypothetical protein
LKGSNLVNFLTSGPFLETRENVVHPDS